MQIANANKDFLKYKTNPFYKKFRKCYEIYNFSQSCRNHSNCLWNYAIHPANYLALLAKTNSEV
ncbi:transcriptional regulator [Salmonella enterica]|nr:transcriptional regulator [Salmonella enterica]ECI3444597.1 transcriptional regulator [Salmonella enterica subsp. houtenae]EAO2616932.1 transcriptional regulator [Salmonella enterica]EAP1483776.1 transcriptional regulator [Salmonella enterica]EAQ7793613.1 transcriptional regulator [Salmonella enterica]